MFSLMLQMKVACYLKLSLEESLMLLFCKELLNVTTSILDACLQVTLPVQLNGKYYLF